MAVDPAFLPLGVPVWLDTKAPDGTPLQRLMVAQDVGSAIKGPIRGDLFWGTGETALEFAGRMKSNGRYYVLLPNSVATRSTFIVTAHGNDGSNLRAQPRVALFVTCLVALFRPSVGFAGVKL